MKREGKKGKTTTTTTSTTSIDSHETACFFSFIMNTDSGFLSVHLSGALN